MNLQPLIDIQLDRGTVTNQVAVWNDATKRYVPSTTLTGITLGTLWTLAEGGAWTGNATLDASDGDKIVTIKNNAVPSFIFRDDIGNSYFALVTETGSEAIEFGSGILNPAFNFIGTGLTTLGGNLLVNGGDIGITADPTLIELASGEVTVNGSLDVDSFFFVDSTFGSVGIGVAVSDDEFILDILGAVGTVSKKEGQLVKVRGGPGIPLSGTGVLTAGRGGEIRLVSGVGGVSTSSDAKSNGGGGGLFTFEAGAGGAANGGDDNGGGAGGGYDITGGGGGQAGQVGNTGANNGGFGGDLFLTGGVGGIAVFGSIATGGNGGDVFLNAGAGGGAFAATSNVSGSDGSIFIGNNFGNVRMGDTTVPTYALEVAGVVKSESGRIKNTTRAVGTYQILASDDQVFGNTDGISYTLTLPASPVEGQSLRIINSGSSGNLLTIAPDAAEHLIGKNSNFFLKDGEALIIVFNSIDGWY